MKKFKILVIDNFDSFTYNLVQYLKEEGNQLNFEVTVFRNNEYIDDDILTNATGIVLSPGPGIPTESGFLVDIVRRSYKNSAILGVCLGHQCLGEFFGGKLINLEKVYHGVGLATKIIDFNDPIFKNIDNNFISGRYHSWVVDYETFPNNLVATATDDNNLVMALKHKELPIWGVQFHPESVLTEDGRKIIKNWLETIIFK